MKYMLDSYGDIWVVPDLDDPDCIPLGFYDVEIEHFYKTKDEPKYSA